MTMATKLSTLRQTIRETERFLATALELRDTGGTVECDDGTVLMQGGPLVSATMRASLDLTRQLAKLRRVEF
jgi:hypothetical protein